MGILLNGASVQLGILYFFYGMSSNVMAWQNSFFMSRLPKHKTQYVKFQTSVSLYLYFEKNIASWIVNPTSNIVYFRRLWGQTLKLGKTHSSRADCRNIKSNMSSFKHLYLCIWTLMGILLIGVLVQLGILYNFLRCLYFERNIANWILNPTWNIVYFRGIWGQTLKLGKMHSSRTHCRKIKRNMSSFKYVFVEYEVKH